MPSKIRFTSVVLESFKRNSKGGSAVLSSSWNQTVAQSMGWSVLPDSVSGASLDGDLAASSMLLTPSDKELKSHALELDITRVHKFEAVRLENEGTKGKGRRIEVRFAVEFAVTNGAKKLEQYMCTVGQGKGSLDVMYTKQLALGEENQQVTDEQKEAVSEEADPAFA